MKALVFAIVPFAILSGAAFAASDGPPTFNVEPSCHACLLYTSDAADE